MHLMKEEIHFLYQGMWSEILTIKFYTKKNHIFLVSGLYISDSLSKTRPLFFTENYKNQ